ncbi:hypothetical protein [Micromonospora endolithica]|uniref:hypothetical protein n=1 Tax=Micromonospora endolithica TaxID=230091 RepID=UPI0011ACA3D2|nr:hypothetical protein [Micromonospora endolithica]TWJ21371.1 hypothetical protein JD76_01481 [Micromonospora endolithica]
MTIDHDRPGADGATATGMSFEVPTDPNDPTGVLAIPAGEDGPDGARQSLLVVTPAAATTVRVLRDGQEVARSPVRRSGAVVTVPGPASGLVVEALDRSGTALADAPVARVGDQLDSLEMDAFNQQ